MEICRKILRLIVFRVVPKFRRYLFFKSAKFSSWIERGELIVEDGVGFNVPVRCDGRGSVMLHKKVGLGFRKAPRMDQGTILLQAREKNALISIGAGTVTSNNVSIVAREHIEIGANCLIGDMVTIIDSDFHNISPTKRHEGSGPTEAVIIHDNVWLGSRVQVLKGVTLGEGCVIAAGAIVTSDIPANVIAGGIPAKVIYAIN